MSTPELSVINPFTETEAFRVPLLQAGEVEGVVSRARAALRQWRGSSLAERVALCEAFIPAFEAMADEVARDITIQMGKPLGQARGEVNGMIGRARHMISIAEATLADEYVPEQAGFVRYIRHEPLGVVLDIAAWNYPLLIAVNVVVPAVLAGNAAIVKHSSRTPRCGEAFAKAFAAAGAPEHLVQAVHADHRVTELLIQHPGVDHVSFTGSVSGGREVNRSAADRFVEVGLELGGKDPAYVCADADLNYAVANCVDGAFYNAGQSCCAIERVYVEAPVYDAFVAEYIKQMDAYRLGDPMEDGVNIGPLASKGAPAFLARQVEDAVKAGGELVVDPAGYAKPGHGYFAAPAVVANAPQHCSLMQEESFGPVIGILRVSGDAEAVKFMNDSAYGLTASIWTADLKRAVRIGEQVETGTFFMNRCDYLDPALPWCGVKDTGRGATLSKYGLLGLSRMKSMHLRTAIPG
ncbi:MAG: aldehyde dehydrogenase family protein [Candidatus Hydrogenedentes bacterium]|nr:aldehyde dehydrogenase family protein [Candidatus Hydrogenedentota bacterium]